MRQLVLAKIVNLLHLLRIPFAARIVLGAESFLWRRPAMIPAFLCAVNPEALWKMAEAKLLFLVRRFTDNTPALLGVKKNHFPSVALRSLEDFQTHFPVLDKDNYVKTHSLEELCQGGRLPHAGGFYKSAGTSGKPTLWTESFEEQAAFDAAVEFMGAAMLGTNKQDYIILNCWELGSWPTGINFSAGARRQGKVVNIGTNLKEAAEMLRILGPEPHYILAGYPPFIHYVVAACKAEGIDLTRYRMHVVSGGEGFVEEWRDELIGIFGKEAVIFSVYGSTDKGLGEGIETNLAYAIRSLLYLASVTLRDETRAQRIALLRFGRPDLPFNAANAREFLLRFVKDERNIGRTPMVFQFNPLAFFNENHPVLDPVQKRRVDEFLTTTLLPFTAIPRVRYNIHDEGRVMRYEEIVDIWREFRIKIADFNPRGDAFFDLKLPFLILYGRSDGTVSVDGANIFPQDVEECLRLDKTMFSSLHSFQLFVSDDYRFGVALELKEGEAGDERDIQARAEALLLRELARFSFGYRELVSDELPSANVVVTVNRYGEGPFKNRTIKLHYVRH